MAKFQSRTIIGEWQKGYALDLQTIGSEFLGYDEYGHAKFRTTRSEIGELLYKLKYAKDMSVVEEIVAAVIKLMKQWKPPIDALVPVPPSSKRAVQPVIVLAKQVAKDLKIPMLDCVTRTREIPQLKNVTDLDERLGLLAGLHKVDKAATQGKSLLLFDDLYRSGATMNSITTELLTKGQATAVFALAITRTRVHQ